MWIPTEHEKYGVGESPFGANFFIPLRPETPGCAFPVLGPPRSTLVQMPKTKNKTKILAWQLRCGFKACTPRAGGCVLWLGWWWCLNSSPRDPMVLGKLPELRDGWARRRTPSWGGVGVRGKRTRLAGHLLRAGRSDFQAGAPGGCMFVCLSSCKWRAIGDPLFPFLNTPPKNRQQWTATIPQGGKENQPPAGGDLKK